METGTCIPIDSLVMGHDLDLYSWPWNDPKIDLKWIWQNSKFKKVKGHLKVNVEVTRSGSILIVRPLWFWPYYSTDILLAKIKTEACILNFGSWTFEVFFILFFHFNLI